MLMNGLKNYRILCILYMIRSHLKKISLFSIGYEFYRFNLNIFDLKFSIMIIYPIITLKIIEHHVVMYLQNMDILNQSFF